MSDAPDREPFVDAKPVAEFLGTTPAYVLKLALTRKIPALALPPLSGKGERPRWRFRMSEVEKWARERQGART